MLKSSDVDSRELFHATCAGVKFDRPPFWMMRQAGRYLPEYRKLKEKHGFLGIVKNPELSVEVALQPIKRFNFDCAILFSDILVISEALGFPYAFKDGGGIVVENKISNASDIKIARDNVAKIRETLGYVAGNASLLRRELPKKAVIGFSGSPFTIAAYMIEGSGVEGFPKFQKFIKEQPELFRDLMDVLTDAIIEYVKMQLEYGIDAIQIFDSHASLTPGGQYREYSGFWISKILEDLEARTRTILFATKMSPRFGEIAPLGAEVYSVDEAVPLSAIFNTWKAPYALQGNLPADILSTGTTKEVIKRTKQIVDDMIPHGRHIFNLGQGILPNAKIENVEAMCDAIRSYEK